MSTSGISMGSKWGFDDFLDLNFSSVLHTLDLEEEEGEKMAYTSPPCYRPAPLSSSSSSSHPLHRYEELYPEGINRSSWGLSLSPPSSVLRTPGSSSYSSGNPVMMISPLLIAPDTSHHHHHHRSIPNHHQNSKIGDEVEAGNSRNSTGSSSSGSSHHSHRSQDSGFSDSASQKNKHLRRGGGRSNNNSRIRGDTPDVNGNGTYTIREGISHPSSLVMTRSREEINSSNNYDVLNANNGNLNLSSTSTSQHSHHSHPHSHQSPHIFCSDCIYQEILSQNQSSSGANGEATTEDNCNATQVLYSTVGEVGDPNAHLGAPICSSTPKRGGGNDTVHHHHQREIMKNMQKIDNFESLNKNKKNVSSCTSSSSSKSLSLSSSLALDNNNNSKSSKKKNKSSSSSSSNSRNTMDFSKPIYEHILQSQRERAPMPLPLPLLPPPEFRNEQNYHEEEEEDTTNPVSKSSFNLSTNSLTSSSHHHQHLRGNASISASSQTPKWSELPKGYKLVSTQDLFTTFRRDKDLQYEEADSSTDSMVVVKSHFDNEAMRMWLHQVRYQTENECLCVLMTKSIPCEEEGKGKSSCGSSTSEDSDSGTYCGGSDKKLKKGENVVQAIHTISGPLRSIKNVEKMASIVSIEFARICKNIEFGFLSLIPKSVLSLIHYVDQFLQAFSSSASGMVPVPSLGKLEHRLARACRRLESSAQEMIEFSPEEDENGNKRSVFSLIEEEVDSSLFLRYRAAVNSVVDGIVSVGNLFSQVVDLRLRRDLSIILDVVEGYGGVPGKVALKNLVSILLDGGNHLCRLASEIRTVRGLLGVTLDSKDDQLKILALRCLATILCVGEAVKDFDRASGFEIISDFINDPKASFDLRIEAISVLTQATDPWIDLETSLCTLSSNLEKILVALTNMIPLCYSQPSEDSFLLVVAALSNLTFLEVSSVEILRNYGTVSFLVESVERKGIHNYSVFVLDHVATILANMAGVESCRSSIISAGGVPALLKFLQKRQSASTNASETMACERVQQKSTIAISRLCGEEGVAVEVLQKGGVHRLVELCRNDKERNYSDGVLIAALATLRKLVGICGEETVRGLQADDLIQPRLLDSFLLYSSRQESYV